MGNFFAEDNMYNRIMTKVFDLCLLNLLTIVCCIPVVTAGASLTAMYSLMMKMVKDQEGAVIKSFIKEFKANLKGSFGGWLVILAGFFLLIFDLALWTQNQVQYKSLFYGLTAAMIMALCVFADWYFAVRAQFEETSKSALKNAGKFALVYLPASVIMGIYTVGLVVLLMHYPTFGMFVPLVGLVILEYPKAFFIREKFDRYIEGCEKVQATDIDDTVEEENESDVVAQEEENKTEASVVEAKQDTIESNAVKIEEHNANDDIGKRDKIGLKEQFAMQLKREKEKMADMTKEQKRDYLLTYYKSWFVMGALLLLIVIGTGYHFIFNNAKCEFSCALVNGYMEKSDTALSDEISDYFGYQPRKQYAYFDTEYQIAYTGVDNEAADTSFYEKFFLNIRMGSLDAAIMPESFMEYCNAIEQVFYDVTQVLSEEQIETYRPYFVTGKNEDGEEYICGIDISHFAFIEKENIGFVNTNADEAIILTFPVNGQHLESCRRFMEFLEKYE